MTILSVVIRVVNGRYRTSWTSVTGSCPCGDCSSKLVLRTKGCRVYQLRPSTRHFQTICEHTFDGSPTDSNSSFLKWWSSKQGAETLYNCSVFLFTSSQNLSTHMFRVSFHVVWPRDSLVRGFLTPRQFFSCSSRNSWFEHFSVLLDYIFVRFTFTLSASQIHVVKKCSLFDKIDQFHRILPRGSLFLLSCSCFDVIHVFWEE